MSRSSRPVRVRPGLPLTLQILSRTRNQAAEALLIPAIDSPAPAIQQGAVRAILERKSHAGQLEIIRRLHTHGQVWQSLLADSRGRMTLALRDALLGTESQTSRNACQAVLWLREYDLVPALVAAAEDETHGHADLAAQTLLSLAELLYQELAAPRDYQLRRDPQLVRHHVVGSLEVSVARLARHKRREVLSAFLMLASRDSATLRAILQDPHHGAYLPLLDALAHDEHAGVLRLLLSFLDDPHAPTSALAVIGRRGDERFVQQLLRKIGFEPGPVAGANLRRIENFAWLRDEGQLLDRLDDSAQHSAVQLVVRSGLRRLDAFQTIQRVLRRGKPGGRRAAAVALADFHGAQANDLAWQLVHDHDPRVQAAVLAQLRPRGVPGSLSKLIELVDSPHEVVRQAARASLAEFNLEKFLTAFDLLDDEVRRSTGLLVKKVNPESCQVLAEELQSPSRTRRLRAIAAAVAMDAVAELETALVARLTADEDHVVRIDAARALGQCGSDAAYAALYGALDDRSALVQEAAEESLQRLDPTFVRPSPRPPRATP